MRVVNLGLALTILALVVAIFNLSPELGSGLSLVGGPDTNIEGVIAGPTAAAHLHPEHEIEAGDAWSTPRGDEPTDPEIQQRGAEALARITYPWRERLPGWEIQFHAAETGAYGYTLTQERHIDIYVRADQSDDLLAHVVAHEIGHAIDVALNDSDDRRRWEDQRRIGDAPWWPDNRAADFATGAGDFAECFAAWQVGSAAFRSGIGTPPSAADLDLLQELASG